MDCCTPNSTTQSNLENSQKMATAADRLATLLEQTEEYQEFNRSSRTVNQDPDVRRLTTEIRKQKMMSFQTDRKNLEALQAELEALPAVQGYHQAEAEVKALFRAVDRIISAAVGVEFGPNAIRSGCG